MTLTKELYCFILKNASASIFGALLLVSMIVTKIFAADWYSGYDLLFCMVVIIQIGLLYYGLETKREFSVVFVFHILATIMELFKTHPAIGSWVYPNAQEAIFVIGSVPLAVGFMYSAVGSYITRATKVMHLQYHHYPKTIYTVVLAAAIYINFFAHHYTYDARYVILILVVVLFWKTEVHFKVYEKTRVLPFIISGLLTTCFVWLAENFATYYQMWLYPNQIDGWQMVSYGKYSSWFLLLVMSFIIVKTLHLRNNISNE